jgi:hypothetical protein
VGELSGKALRLVGRETLAFGNIAKRHVVHALEGKEDLAGGRLPTGTVQQLPLCRPQPVGVLHELVETLDLELDLEQPARRRRVQGDAVVAIVDADISGLADQSLTTPESTAVQSRSSPWMSVLRMATPWKLVIPASRAGK